mmetsp:Transcript_6786/g.9777  ORF Transcript_6786/g.9777 Transcript_6786/m.9777 type:complete len:146 (-) Transcript_6786:139-576(-)
MKTTTYAFISAILGIFQPRSLVAIHIIDDYDEFDNFYNEKIISEIDNNAEYDSILAAEIALIEEDIAHSKLEEIIDSNIIHLDTEIKGHAERTACDFDEFALEEKILHDELFEKYGDYDRILGSTRRHMLRNRSIRMGHSSIPTL